MSKGLKIALMIILVCGLIAIRMFADILFYDPLIEFFKTNHSTDKLPEMLDIKLILNISFRFLLNTALSIGILWVLFQKKDIIKLSLILYVMLFVIAIVCFYFLIQSETAGEHMVLFYVRRFLIQPIFLLILIPAFYFQKKL